MGDDNEIEEMGIEFHYSNGTTIGYVGGFYLDEAVIKKKVERMTGNTPHPVKQGLSTAKTAFKRTFLTGGTGIVLATASVLEPLSGSGICGYHGWACVGAGMVF